MLMRPLELYKVPKWGPERDKYVYSLFNNGEKSLWATADRMIMLPRECP
jgi:hypothetical protein